MPVSIQGTVMKQQNASKSAHPAPRSRLTKMIVLGLILGFICVALLLLPRGFSDDLSQIGKGSNVVVLVHDHETATSQELMNVINKVRDEYEGRIQFLVADKYAPEGKVFLQTYGIDSVALVFFAPDGKRLDTLFSPRADEDGLRRTFNRVFDQ
jgi:thioredoxin-like negative regulator of GroEL